MRISPLGYNNQANTAQLISMLQPKDKVSELFSTINSTQTEFVTDRPWWIQDTTPNVFDRMAAMNQAIYEQYKGKDDVRYVAPFIDIYLQSKSDYLKDLAEDITKGLTSNDDKATAIVYYAIFNISYMTDQENYGYDEFWAPAAETARRGLGDCEDSSFLIHSLMLHAGIPHDRIRTYGGFVDDNQGAVGGHAWTAYRRETDDEWVILDAAYWPNLKHVENRPLMRHAEYYKENYFWFNKVEWHSLTNLDMIHNPSATYNERGILDNKLKLLGALENIYA